MKRGISIQDLSVQLKSQANMQKDFVSPTQRLSLSMREELAPIETDSSVLDQLLSKIATNPNGVPVVADAQPVQATADDPAIHLSPHLVVDEVGVLKPNKIFHEQLAAKLQIPSQYYNRMYHRQPELLIDTANTWLHEKTVKNNMQVPMHGDRLVRSIGNTARAFLSNRYRVLDHLPLMMSVIGLLDEMDVAPEHIVSCNVTDSKLYLKVLTPKLKGEVEKGDIVQGGLVVTNSEVGKGSVSVQPLIFRLSCLNGAVMQDAGMRQHHLGSILRDQASDGAWQMLTTETKQKADDAFFSSVQDVIRGTLNDEVFGLQLEKMKAANKDEVKEYIPASVEMLSKSYSLNEAESSNVLDNFITGNNHTRWGMANAVTLASQKVDSYDRASELERVGGKILEMPATTWEQIASAE